MKEHKKELIIIPYSHENTSELISAKIMYNNYEIGICEFQIGPQFPNISTSMIGAPFNTQYTYTLIFNEKENENDKSLNIATNSIQTNGFYKLNSGVFVENSNLNVPIGTYKNIGQSPLGIKYNLELITDKLVSKIILTRIC